MHFPAATDLALRVKDLFRKGERCSRLGMITVAVAASDNLFVSISGEV